MKITKTKLIKIIKEEIGKVTQEMAPKGSLAGAAAQLDREAGADLSPEQKEQLAYLLAKRGKQLASDPVKRNRQINYWIDLIKQRGQKDLDVTPSYVDDEDDMKAIAESIIGILTLMKEQDDPQAMMVRGAKGAGRDPFSVEKIRINPDGSFKARLNSAQLEKAVRVAGQLDHNSIALLQQKGALEKPKETRPQRGEPQSPAHKAMMDGIDRIKANYEGGEAGIPPAVEKLEDLVNAFDLEGMRGEITDIWNALLKWHQRSGTKLNHNTTTTFNNLNTLVRNLV